MNADQAPSLLHPNAPTSKVVQLYQWFRLERNLVTPAFVIARLREIAEPARKAMIVDLALSQMRGWAKELLW